jgi:hypothetical protein
MVWPSLRRGVEIGPHRVHSNIGSFFIEGFVGSKAVFEKTVLPANMCRFGDGAFPVTDELVHRLLLTKEHNRVEVIRHGEKKMYPPFFRANIVFGGRYQDIENIGFGETVATAMGAANCYEED